jgi:hypothetical protein
MAEAGGFLLLLWGASAAPLQQDPDAFADDGYVLFHPFEPNIPLLVSREERRSISPACSRNCSSTANVDLVMMAT